MARCEECVHSRVCEEVNGLKCRPDFIWYNAKFGCPYYSAGIEPRAVVDLYKQLNDELEDELAIAYNRLEDARAELAREIFGGIEILKQSCVKSELFKGAWFDMRAFEDGLSALEKKYMKPEPPKTNP